jgi:hypothetical protein
VFLDPGARAEFILRRASKTRPDGAAVAEVFYAPFWQRRVAYAFAYPQLHD